MVSKLTVFGNLVYYMQPPTGPCDQGPSPPARRLPVKRESSVLNAKPPSAEGGLFLTQRRKGEKAQRLIVGGGELLGGVEVENVANERLDVGSALFIQPGVTTNVHDDGLKFGGVYGLRGEGGDGGVEGLAAGGVVLLIPFLFVFVRFQEGIRIGNDILTGWASPSRGPGVVIVGSAT